MTLLLSVWLGSERTVILLFFNGLPLVGRGRGWGWGKDKRCSGAAAGVGVRVGGRDKCRSGAPWPPAKFVWQVPASELCLKNRDQTKPNQNNSRNSRSNNITTKSHSDFEANLSYLRTCLKNQKREELEK